MAKYVKVLSFWYRNVKVLNPFWGTSVQRPKSVVKCAKALSPCLGTECAKALSWHLEPWCKVVFVGAL